MNASPLALQVIKHYEEFKAQAYQDPAGIWTIGYGTIRVNGRRVTRGMVCTEADALRWMHDHLNADIPAILRLCGRSLKQFELDALCSFVYNLGVENFEKSTLCKNIRANRSVTETNFTGWNKARVNGVLTPLNGLTRRRRTEYVLFTTGQVQFTF